MGEIGTEITKHDETRKSGPVLDSREKVNKLQIIPDAIISGVPENITVSGILNEGALGWLLRGRTDRDWRTVVKLANSPVEESGPHYDNNANMLRLASQRTYFVPSYYGHGLTEVPGEDGKFPFLAMEDIQGRTLSELIDEKYVSIQTSLNILRTVARGVDALLGENEYGESKDGRKPIISTDLKPSNIMIRDKNGSPVLIDFDIARNEGDLSHFSLDDQGRGEMKGSLLYAGPELINDGKEITRALNTWQLGAIAFEMLTHEKFFNVENQLAIVYRCSSKEAFDEYLQQRLSQAASESTLPEATRAVLARALAFNPEDRYASAQEFVEALESAEEAYIEYSGGRKHRADPLSRSITQHQHPDRRGTERGHHENHKDSSHPEQHRDKQRGRHALQPRQGPKHRRVNSSR